MNRTSLRLGLCALALLAAPATAQDANFKELIEQGRYPELADKLEQHLELDRYDDRLRAYVQMNLDYLRRGARPKTPGSEIILVRGAKNDRLYQMPNAAGKKKKDDAPGLFDEPETYPSGGPRLMLPNRIRYARRSWDARLPLIDRYFREATSLLGGDGDALRELEKIIEHHKGGGLGTSANSTKSVLISASTRPLWAFGPPYYIIKIAPERCIFNYKGLSGEFEVLIPFWILPHEIVYRADSREEVENHPLYRDGNPFKDLEFYDTSAGYPYVNNWELIEDNIRHGRPALPLNPDGIRVLAGTVSTSGSKVYVHEDGDELRLTGSLARSLRKFRGLEVRVKAKPDGDDFEVTEVLSPVETTLVAEVIKDWDDEIKLYTNSGDTATVSGTPSRALPRVLDRLIEVEGYAFTDSYGDVEHIYLSAIRAKATSSVDMRVGDELAPGDAVRITYVSRSGRSAIVKHEGGWGWARLDELDLTAAPASASGLVGSAAFGN